MTAGDEVLDVLVVGAGVSGIAAGVLLQRDCPGKRFEIIEARDAIGGTWDLFRYPGIRSDSDMYSYAYSFRPWTDPRAIVDAATIRGYLRDTVREHHLDARIRFGQRLLDADWDSASARWTARIAIGADGEIRTLRCRLLLVCAGYFRYDAGYRPHFPGEEVFQGVIVHPQHWPAALDWRGKRVVVIGSGATAVTLVPAMAREAASVTMLQRSPSWIVARPAVDWVAGPLSRVLPAAMVGRLLRAKYILRDWLFFRAATWLPTLTGWILRLLARHELGPGADMAPFTPRYPPWRQRLCLVPDGDFFAALREGRARVVTDTIASFTADGLRLDSGRELPADIVVSATGLEMDLMHGLALRVDGVPVRLADTISYKGCMFSGLPNLVSAFGYANASWTLKAELCVGFACRILAHLDRSGTDWCVPVTEAVTPSPDALMPLQSGYVARARDRLPRQGASDPWRFRHDLVRDRWLLRDAPLEDGALRFFRIGAGTIG